MVNYIQHFTYAEQTLKKYSIIFTLIVMYQGLFGGMSLKNKPMQLEKLSNNIYFKYFTLFCIAFTATQDIEISLLSICVFVILFNIIRTKEERDKYGFFNL
jgi:hypothetical protein